MAPTAVPPTLRGGEQGRFGRSYSGEQGFPGEKGIHPGVSQPFRSRPLPRVDTGPAAAPSLLPRRSRKFEVTLHGKTLLLSNVEKLFWPREGYTKGDLIEYYLKIAPLPLAPPQRLSTSAGPLSRRDRWKVLLPKRSAPLPSRLAAHRRGGFKGKKKKHPLLSGRGCCGSFVSDQPRLHRDSSLAVEDGCPRSSDLNGL
ncbi:DNA ligase domain protein [Heliomicrobium modesticaldum Ice1]|uniref:DNA ligase domain protein n=1 Tax=Heliobacterium modesticaldum (strain ATCC 51547 / Ice1) TaxID=498761 RepID=B0TIF0_HELMI|nr:DNA ligase domain protein [Heliomicrobium modesticaldum Ice1]